MAGKKEQGAAASASRVVTPLDVQQVEFRVSRFGGYRMRDVDEFLDRLTTTLSNLLAENERLRAQTGSAPVVGAPDLDEVGRQADEIIQRARDEAARIVAEAKEQAARTAGVSAVGIATDERERAAVQAFLVQEREFLQSLAGLVQEHAESVKAMAKASRGGPVTETTVQASEPPAQEPVEPPDQEPVEGTAAEEPVNEEAASETSPERPDEGSSSADVEATQTMPPLDKPIAEGDEPEGDASLRDLFWGEEN